MRSRPSLIFFFCALLSLTGCPSFSPKLPSVEGYRSVSPAEAAEFLAAVRATTAKIHSARGRYKASVAKGLSRQDAEQVVVFERPDKLRLELFASSLNQLTLMVVSREDQIEAFDPGEKTLYRGWSTPGNIARILGVPLLPEELMLWFSGAVVLPEDSELTVLRHPEKNIYALSGPISYGRFLRARFETGEAGPRLLSLELRRESDSELFFFSEFTYGPENGAQKITFHLPEQKLSGDLTRESFQVNPQSLSPRLFEIPPREGVSIKLLE